MHLPFVPSPVERAPRLRRRHAALACVLALAASATGCSGDANPIKEAYVGAGYGPKPVEAPDFVARSRREEADYLPVGESAPRRPVRARSSEGQRALEAELEGARSRNEARGRAAAGAARATGVP